MLLASPDLLNPPDVVGKFATGMPHLSNEQLQAKAELYLLETDELIDHQLATPPDMKLVGGLKNMPGMRFEIFHGFGNTGSSHSIRWNSYKIGPWKRL